MGRYYRVETTVNGEKTIRHNQPWFNAYMDANDLVRKLRGQPSSATPEPEIEVAIVDEYNRTQATYSNQSGWVFALKD